MADLRVDYFHPMRERLQTRLNSLWQNLLRHGQIVIVEDGTWKREERDGIRGLANELHAVTEMPLF
jgi:predicted kinase